MISAGRAILGVGAAWNVDEHGAYGIDFPAVRERMDRLDEALSMCTSLFEQERATFAGSHYMIKDAYNSPRPIRGSLPVLVGVVVGGGHCERVGRDYSDITRAAFVSLPQDMDRCVPVFESPAEAGAHGVVIQGMLEAARLRTDGSALIRVFP